MSVAAVTRLLSKNAAAPIFPHSLASTMPPAALFRGVVAHVSVTLDDGVDASRPFAGKLTKHGGRTVKKFLTNGLTHLIFRGSSAAASSFAARARDAKASIKVVAPSWVTACERAGKIVDEKDHKVRGLESMGASTSTPLSRWSSLDAKVRRTPTAKERMGKRPRDVERVELSRYDSDARRMEEALREEREKTATMTFADAVKGEREAKRRKTVEDGEGDDDGDKENDVVKVNAEATTAVTAEA